MTSEQDFDGRVFDVAVIGAGINGAAVARDCAMRRLSVALLEKNDIGGGSSYSHAGLLQGRLRYFETLENPSRAVAAEIAILERIGGNLLTRVPIVLPSLDGDRRAYLERLETFAEAYDRFAAVKGGKPHRRLTGDETRKLESGFAETVRGAVTIDEWLVDTHRMVLLQVKSAVAAGAELLLGTSVERIVVQQGKLLGLAVRVGGRAPQLLRAKTVINATGPWIPFLEGEAAGRTAFRATKSVYVVFDRRIAGPGVYCPLGNDGRGIALLPFHDRSILGATETEFFGHPERPDVFPDEIGALYHAARRYFPRLSEHRPLAAFAGVRPRVPPKSSDADHVLVDHARQGAEGVYTLYGGTFATFRRGAEDATTAVGQRLRVRERCRTHLETLPGTATDIPWEDEARRTGLDPIATRKLLYRHGYDGLKILEDARREPELARTLCECERVLAAEVNYAVKYEWARSLEAVARRTRLGMGSCGGCRCAGPAARFVGSLCKWTKEETGAEARRFLERRSEEAAPVLFGERLAQQEYAHCLDSFGGDES